MNRHRQLNVPIEIVRTMVAISETGSLSKAAEKLGLSQPAVSSQIKRIQNLLGGPVFTRTANGTTSTPLGKLVLNQARKMLEANDQMLRLGGAADGPQPVRLGISTLFVEQFFLQQNAETLANVVIHADISAGITRGLLEGYIDIGCIYENSEIVESIQAMVVKESHESFVWVRSKDFVLRPGAPIPILTWPGDDLMISTLTRLGLTYKIVFSSPDYHSKLAALEAGIGIAALPGRLIPSTLMQAEEYYLPELPPVKALLCTRPEIDAARTAKLLELLSSRFFAGPLQLGVLKPQVSSRGRVTP
jgi:molybdate transport repressor ModE-like protein